MGNYINKALLGASPYKSQKAESAKLVNKWEKTGLLDGLNEDFKKSGMAVMLENQAKQLVQEAGVSTTSPSGAGVGNDEEWSGVALPLVRRIFGEIAAQDFVSVQPMNLPSGLVFYLDFKYGKTLAGKTAGRSLGGTTGANNPAANRDTHGEGGLYGVGAFGYSISQSIEAGANDTGFKLATGATPGAQSGSALQMTTGAHYQHDTELSASVAADSKETWKLGFAKSQFSNPDLLSVRSWQVSSAADITIDASKTNAASALNYTDTNYIYLHVVTGDESFTGGAGIATVVDDVKVAYQVQPAEADRGDFESSVGKNMEIPEVDLQLNSSAIVAKTRKLKAVWTPELAQDLNAYHSVDAEAELTSMLSEYISMEIDLEILDMLIQDATTTDYWSVVQGEDYDANAGAFTDNSFTGTRFEWWQTLGAKVQKTSNEIHRLTLRGGANFLVCSPKVATILESLPGYNSISENAAAQFAMGVSKIGGIDGRYSVYKNPYMTENTILIGFRGSNFLETGAVYAPYVPLIMTPLVYDPTDFTPRKGVMTRYAKKMIRPEFYGKIKIKGLEKL
jgi:hypothetical protein